MKKFPVIASLVLCLFLCLVSCDNSINEGDVPQTDIDRFYQDYSGEQAHAAGVDIVNQYHAIQSLGVENKKIYDETLDKLWADYQSAAQDLETRLDAGEIEQSEYDSLCWEVERDYRIKVLECETEWRSRPVWSPFRSVLIVENSSEENRTVRFGLFVGNMMTGAGTTYTADPIEVPAGSRKTYTVEIDVGGKYLWNNYYYGITVL